MARAYSAAALESPSAAYASLTKPKVAGSGTRATAESPYSMTRRQRPRAAPRREAAARCAVLDAAAPAPAGCLEAREARQQSVVAGKHLKALPERKLGLRESSAASRQVGRTHVQ